MKRILSTLFVTSVAICSASAAKAELFDTSVHKGDIPTDCSVVANAQPALLSPNSTTSPTSISSEGGIGQFKMICNTVHSLRVELLPPTATSHPTISSEAFYKEEFKLSDAPAAYSTLNTTDFVTAAVDKSGLPATNASGYIVKVAAKGSVSGASYVLPPGSYTINVKATITPS